MNNPWVLALPEGRSPAGEAVVAQAPVLVAPTTLGARAPQRGIAPPDQVDRLPSVLHRAPASLWWLGVHGGAGESTLAGLAAGTAPAEHGWPVLLGVARVAQPTVLVARANASVLRAAQRAAQQWAAGATPPVELIGLVLVADAPGRQPRPLRDLARLVAGGVPATWHLPWVEDWRLQEHPTYESAPRDVRRVVDAVAARPLPLAIPVSEDPTTKGTAR